MYPMQNWGHIFIAYQKVKFTIMPMKYFRHYLYNIFLNFSLNWHPLFNWQFQLHGTLVISVCIAIAFHLKRQA